MATIQKIIDQVDEMKPNAFTEERKTYYDGCAMFAVMHIHSALSGKTYTHPDDFVTELAAVDGSFVTATGWPGEFENVGPVFEALGYKVAVYTGAVTTESYEEMTAALARGAYVYAQISTRNCLCQRAFGQERW